MSQLEIGLVTVVAITLLFATFCWGYYLGTVNTVAYLKRAYSAVLEAQVRNAKVSSLYPRKDN